MPALAAPSVAMPALAAPSVAMPALAAPSVAKPALAAPSVAMPALAAPWVAMPALAILALFAAASPALAQDVGLPIGSTPAAAEVEDLDGNAVQLGSLLGKKPVLVEFWATWCPLCEKLEPQLQEAKRTFGDRVDFIVVAVGVNQTPRTIRRHTADQEPVGPIFFDRRGAAVRAFMTPTTSYVVILDATGKVSYTGTGDRQPISEALAKVAGE